MKSLYTRLAPSKLGCTCSNSCELASSNIFANALIFVSLNYATLTPALSRKECLKENPRKERTKGNYLYSQSSTCLGIPLTIAPGLFKSAEGLTSRLQTVLESGLRKHFPSILKKCSAPQQSGFTMFQL